MRVRSHTPLQLGWSSLGGRVFLAWLPALILGVAACSATCPPGSKQEGDLCKRITPGSGGTTGEASDGPAAGGAGADTKTNANAVAAAPGKSGSGGQAEGGSGGMALAGGAGAAAASGGGGAALAGAGGEPSAGAGGMSSASASSNCSMPSKAEECDNVDNDCDGTVDEGVEMPLRRVFESAL